MGSVIINLSFEEKSVVNGVLKISYANTSDIHFTMLRQVCGCHLNHPHADAGTVTAEPDEETVIADRKSVV